MKYYVGAMIFSGKISSLKRHKIKVLQPNQLHKSFFLLSTLLLSAKRQEAKQAHRVVL